MNPLKRTIRRPELKQLVPLSDSTIYEMEKRGEFPSRFALTPRCVVWDYEEVLAWIAARKEAASQANHKPDVHKRRTRPVQVAA